MNKFNDDGIIIPLMVLQHFDIEEILIYFAGESKRGSCNDFAWFQYAPPDLSDFRSLGV